ncbi:hypothetical protein ASPSYDRAFT_974359 [Aspergillus sydowii CBS 593.65]|uniref:Uncharacterized protein n=1 Tax=Aspergillus sydowii CBS 593.65 TaxID=1036612 RepID=A0A1L9TH93_9EURO|nr:uncharacterized protein ASPSYDRAFT_974359 [Aspergillus sydowii CBS 593.65]OJJ58796.1 hypothetical protein ASPSYDRAFT_974359 [Aspergillus sydowii CBS 593.65]
MTCLSSCFDFGYPILILSMSCIISVIKCCILALDCLCLSLYRIFCSHASSANIV